MISAIFHKFFSSRNERLICDYRKRIEAIHLFSNECKKLTAEDFKLKTQEFKERIASGDSLEAILPEAFAVCQEVSSRILNMRHFDVQLIGAMVLHEGKIAEMGTGEGKTLVATLAVYLNALSGKGVHVVTVNDYLATRDAEWMGRLYTALGLSVGVNLPHLTIEEKKIAYQADITYGTNNEFGFDYLRDNMVYETGMRVQRPLHYAVVDEVDSILIDEARTPLIISGEAQDQTEIYLQLNKLARHLERQLEDDRPLAITSQNKGDYIIDEKSHQIYLTECGYEKVENLLAEWNLVNRGESLYSPQNISLMHHVYAVLRAHFLYFRDQHYVVQAGTVVIVDDFTGRMMPGRRWADGLHQAIEAKENVQIQPENQMLASITFQNYFRLYEKLAGMTGTADTEAYEFKQIYNLETVVVPSNKSSKRIDYQDQVFKTSAGRYRAVLRDIQENYERRRPVLVGTTSIDASEFLSNLLRKAKLPHQVLNAKQHENEAAIIAQAGRPEMITIATNMAGRGTDIVLGGNFEQQRSTILNNALLSESDKKEKIQKLYDDWERLHNFVTDRGGLHVIGTERHESRRIDNQLRGRAARQGDPGSSRFFLSLEDPLLRIFAGDRIRAIMDRFNLSEDEPIEARLLTRRIEAAQKKVEARNFDIRKQLLEYDNVANDQRKVFYKQRNLFLESSDISDVVLDILRSVVLDAVNAHPIHESTESLKNFKVLRTLLEQQYHITFPAEINVQGLSEENYKNIILQAACNAYEKKVAYIGRQAFSSFERSVTLQALDMRWREHLVALDYLRQGIHLRGYAQKNPQDEYKKEAFDLLLQTLALVKEDIVRVIMSTELELGASENSERQWKSVEMIYSNGEQGRNYVPMAEKHRLQDASNHVQFQELGTEDADKFHDMKTSSQIKANDFLKIGRNERCPCNSGKKYKHCHGRLI